MIGEFMKTLADLAVVTAKLATDVADVKAKLVAAEAQVADLTTQLAAFQNDAVAVDAAVTSLEATDAALIA